ncbi:MAG: 2Fe-2S iron-sulfur cluster-binding protein [Thermosynechococcaceae cyanobacterium MS004]|nr:2Fe-2S iron-sulfur cluster-binding protein [Thermosynechococcaceae cyanobacterium MS004]
MFSPTDQVYRVTLLDAATESTTTLQVGSDETILDSALDQGVDLPASCYTGKCITCVCRLVEGSVEQEQVALKPTEIEAGFILTCKSYPRSDCVLLIHQEEELLNWED